MARLRPVERRNAPVERNEDARPTRPSTLGHLRSRAANRRAAAWIEPVVGDDLVEATSATELLQKPEYPAAAPSPQKNSAEPGRPEAIEVELLGAQSPNDSSISSNDH
jgi:hypothetical protein